MGLSEHDRQRWAIIDGVCHDHKDMLKNVSDHNELKEFAKSQGWMNKSDFGKYKVSLRKLGIDYNQIREEFFTQENQRRIKQIESLDDDAPTVYVATGAVDDPASGDGSFAIVDDDGEALWYGSFFKDDKTRKPGDLISAEQSVAEKAVWFAFKCFEAKGISTGWVDIQTTCPKLDEQKLKALGARYGVGVRLHVDDDLKAVYMAESPGYKKWQENNLADCVVVDDER